MCSVTVQEEKRYMTIITAYLRVISHTDKCHDSGKRAGPNTGLNANGRIHERNLVLGQNVTRIDSMRAPEKGGQYLIVLLDIIAEQVGA